MDLRVDCICKRLLKFTTVLSMFGDVASKAYKDGLVKSFGTSVRLRMLRCCCRVFSKVESTYRSNGFAYQLSTINTEYILRDPVWNESWINGDICNVRSFCLGRWNRSNQFGVVVGNETFVLGTLCWFGKLYQNIHCNRDYWTRRWEELQFKAVAILRYFGLFLAQLEHELTLWPTRWRCRASKKCDIVCCKCVLGLYF